MKIEIGKSYVSNEGEIVTINRLVHDVHSSNYLSTRNKFAGSDGMNYAPDGTFLSHPSPMDLVAEHNVP